MPGGYYTTALTDATGGGVWSIDNTNIATISPGGVITGVAQGSANVFYTVTDGNGCTNYQTAPISVNPAPLITASATPTSICLGQTSTLLATSPSSTSTTLCFSNNTQGGFEDGTGDLDRTIPVAGIPAGATITAITITVNVLHQRDREVEMYLIAPGGTLNPAPNGTYVHTSVAGGSITLEGDYTGGNFANFTNTEFSDAGTMLASAGAAPFTGDYLPVNSFASLNRTAANVNGTWTFVVLDHVNSGYTGVFQNATLCITYTVSGLTYVWSSMPTGYTSTSGGPNIVTPTVNTTYTVTGTANNGCSAQAQATVNVNPLPTITLGGFPSVCRGVTTANLPYTATTGTPNEYSIVWTGAAPGQGFTNVTNVTLGTSPIVITVPAAAAAATYTGNLTVTNSTSGCASATVPITVTVTASPTITLGASPTVCSGTTTANLPYTATTGAPNQYSITYSAAAIAAGFVNVTNATLNATPIVLNGSCRCSRLVYNATLIVTNTTTGCSSTSSAFTVTINAAPTITLGANPTVCSGTTTANLPLPRQLAPRTNTVSLTALLL